MAFIDRLDKEVLADNVERWSKHHEVLAARYNGRPVMIPTNYHWELQHKGEVLGIFKTREEACEEMNKRKVARYEDKTIKVGLPKYVQD